MYAAAVLLVLGALTIFGIAHGSEPEPISLVITTHNPACTAAHLDYLGVTRLTDVKPWVRYGVLGYTHTEITSGVNVTAVVWARDSNVTIPAILERPEVSGVAAYSRVAPNSTEAPTPLAKYDNPDVKLPHMGLPTTCGLVFKYMLLAMMDDIGWGGAGPGAMPADRKEVDHVRPGMPATPEPVPPIFDIVSPTRVDAESGVLYAGDLMGVEIYTTNYTSVWAYLKENGALVFGAGRGAVAGYVPPSVLWPLLMRDDIYGIREAKQPAQAMRVPIIPHGIEPDPTSISLVVTTHNPACTAVHLDHLGIVRLTDVRPWYRDGSFGYTSNDIIDGVNVTAAVWARDSNTAIPAILERPEVSSVSTYSRVAPNSTEAPTPLAEYDNPDVIRPDMGHPTRCGLATNHMLLVMMDGIGWGGAGPDAAPADRKEVDHVSPGMPATPEPIPLTLDTAYTTRVDTKSGTVYVGDLMGVEIWTSNHTAVWAHLKGNGALVTGAAPGVVAGYIPPSMLWSIIIRDDVSGIRESKLPAQEYCGMASTEGPSVCEAAPGTTHGNKSDPAPVHLNVTTHNPVCTAAFLHHINVTRLTDVRPLYRDGVRGYGADQYENGVNVTAIIWPRDAAKVMRAIAERTEVRGVAAYPHGTQNVTEPSPPLALAANPNVETPEFYGAATRCDVISDPDLLQMFMDEVVGWNGAPDPVPRYAAIAEEVVESAPINLTLDPRPADQKDPISKIYYYGDLVRVGVWTYNVTDAWAHLQKNGALVIYAVDNGESLGKVGAYMPISLMWSLHERDGVWLVEVIQGWYLE